MWFKNQLINLNNKKELDQKYQQQQQFSLNK